MLLNIHIKDLILIEDANIAFGMGLNVLSGETGSGKSAFMHALYLLKGEKANSEWIRHGKDKAIVEGTFSVHSRIILFHLLEQEDVEWDKNSPLEIRREITKNGKSRALINQQLVSLSLLRKVGQILFKMTGQHASVELFSLERHRAIVDAFGETHSTLSIYENCYLETIEAKETLKKLIDSESQRLRSIEHIERELEELEHVNIQENEEELLLAEYEQLSKNDELKDITSKALELFQNERGGILALLKREKPLIEQLSKVKQNTWFEILQSIINESEELSFSIQSAYTQLEASPERLMVLQERLTFIHKIKKKYGANITAIYSYRDQQKNQLQNLLEVEDQIVKLNQLIPDYEAKLKDAAEKLTEIRSKVAISLGILLTTELQSLNMPKCLFSIKVTNIDYQRHGANHIEFFLTPNTGEKAISLKDSASGGEVSRVLLALNLSLAGKEPSESYVFDEIDANIGGETAVLIGQKLKELAKHAQVFCITHFPQVAALADHHFQVAKLEKEGRTFSNILALSSSSRDVELQRMLGGHKDLLTRLPS